MSGTLERRRRRDDRLVGQRAIDLLFLLQIAVNFLVLAYLAGALYFAQVHINDISVRQIEIVHIQNETQLCAQHDMVTTIKKIGRKLGLPVSDIRPPAVEGLNCAALLATPDDPSSGAPAPGG